MNRGPDPRAGQSWDDWKAMLERDQLERDLDYKRSLPIATRPPVARKVEDVPPEPDPDPEVEL